MKEQETERMHVRMTKEFKQAVESTARKENLDVSTLVRRSVKEHASNLWGTLRLLKMLVPLPPNGGRKYSLIAEDRIVDDMILPDGWGD